MSWRQGLDAFARMAPPTLAAHRQLDAALRRISHVGALMSTLDEAATWRRAAEMASAAPTLAPFALAALLDRAWADRSWEGACAVLGAYAARMPTSVRTADFETLLLLEFKNNPRLTVAHDPTRVAEIVEAAARAAKARGDPVLLTRSLREAATRIACLKSIDAWSSPSRRDDGGLGDTQWSRALARLAAAYAAASRASVGSAHPSRLEAGYVMSLFKKRLNWADAIAVAQRFAATNGGSEALHGRADHAPDTTNPDTGSAQDVPKRAPAAAKNIDTGNAGFIEHLALQVLRMRPEDSRPPVARAVTVGAGPSAPPWGDAVADPLAECPVLNWALRGALVRDRDLARVLSHLLAACSWRGAMAVLRWAHYPPSLPHDAMANATAAVILTAIDDQRRRCIEADGGRGLHRVVPTDVFAYAFDVAGTWVGGLHVVAAMRAAAGPPGSPARVRLDADYAAVVAYHERTFSQAAGGAYLRRPGWARTLAFVGHGNSRAEQAALTGPELLRQHEAAVLLRLSRCLAVTAKFTETRRTDKAPPTQLVEAMLEVATRDDTVKRQLLRS